MYKIRFMPDSLGDWTYTTSSNKPELKGKTGSFQCVAPLAGVHGPVRVRNTQHFAYADGTPFSSFGTTSYAWVHQPEALQEETLKSLAGAHFNKIRMCVFPKSYSYNHNEPPIYPFERNGDKNDYTRLNPAYFTHIEKCIADLRKLNIEADLILFHPYDRWGFASMPPDADDRYLKYVVARMAAYRNVWWSMANEWDLMRAKSHTDFDRFFQIVQKHDPSQHLRSVHQSHTMYDHSLPWVTHASLQGGHFESAQKWLLEWKKPICFDEVQYEGNLNKDWGNLSGLEMTARFWQGFIQGCYVTHGETYLDPDAPMDVKITQTLWWGTGGKLKGSSPERIGFLRKLVEGMADASGKDSKCTGLQNIKSHYHYTGIFLCRRWNDRAADPALHGCTPTQLRRDFLAPWNVHCRAGRSLGDDHSPAPGTVQRRRQYPPGGKAVSGCETEPRLREPFFCSWSGSQAPTKTG